jgi:formylglycine-generating enzyme
MRFWICCAMVFLPLIGDAQTFTPMSSISAGTFVPVLGVDSSGVFIADFYMDVFPVTNAQYLAFVQGHPSWKKSRVIALYADKGYLSTWSSDTTWAEDLPPNAPVTGVSWFAAREYCACLGKRLPDTDEWEYAAMASETKKDARKDSLFNMAILRGYESPKTYAKAVGRGQKNYWGVYELHGTVWEWTRDFNSVLISGESRKDGQTDRQLFCAGGSVGATDLMNYAAFMRYAFRGSLKANYCVKNLGFRCVSDKRI